MGKLSVVEDVITLTKRHLYDQKLQDMLTKFFISFVTSIDEWVVRHGRALTTEQARTIMSLLDRVTPYLLTKGVTQEEITALKLHPAYRQPVVPSVNVPREVRHGGGNRLVFRSKRNDLFKAALMNIFDDIASFEEGPDWEWTHRVHIVTVTPENVSQIEKLIVEFKFDLDLGAAQCLADAHNASGRPVSVAYDPDSHSFVIAAYNALVDRWCARVLAAEEIGFRAYQIPASPSVARRLKRLDRVIDCDIDPEVDAIAAQDLFDEAELPHTFQGSEKYVSLVQQFLDYDLRVLVTSSAYNSIITCAFIAARKLGVKYVVTEEGPSQSILVAAEKHAGIKAAEFFLKSDEPSFGKYRDEALYLSLRHGLSYPQTQDTMAMEFPRSIVFGQPSKSLFEGYPDRVRVFSGDREFMKEQFRDVHMKDFGFLFNTIMPEGILT